jgi:hypothetical protein
VSPSCSTMNQAVCLYSRKRVWQGCLHQSWQSPHANEELCWHQSGTVPVTSHGSRLGKWSTVFAPVADLWLGL